MKSMLCWFSIALLLSCNSQSTETNNSLKNTTGSQDSVACEHALRFANEYISNARNATKQQHDSAWLFANPALSEKFKNEYRKLVDSANKADPELGLGFDPILDAQDYPDKGFDLKDCQPETGYITLQGKEWKDFHLVVKVIKQENTWKIDGAGIINIPPDKQIKK